MIPRLLLPVAALLLLTALPPVPVGAEPDQALQPPVLRGIVLDGTLARDEWADAARLPFAAIDIPALAPPDEARVAPEVHLAVAGGRLCVAVHMREPPGTAAGVHLMVAPEGTPSAADAVSLTFKPVELRAPRYRAIGPRGVGREHYRLEGAFGWTSGEIVYKGAEVGGTPDTWALEAGIPLVDLVGERREQALRVAVVVFTRTPNVIGAWPAGAVWKAPAHWNGVLPPDGGWPTDVAVDSKRLAAEDAADAQRLKAWLRYQQGASTPVLPIKPRREILAEIRTNLLEPLEDVLAHRPDLRVPVLCIRGDIEHRLGLRAAAEETYREAMLTCPPWREARYGYEVKVRGPGRAEGAAGAATNYESARDALRVRAHMLPPLHGLEKDGYDLGRALLAYKEGRFGEAIPILERLTQRFPFDAFIEAHGRLAHRGRRAAGEERNLRARDEGRDLPRATVKTTQGTFVIELFLQDGANAANNFIWLAQHGFYDGLAVHHTVPFFLLQTGCPYSKADAEHPEHIGSGTPGYAIRTQVGPRRPLRGAVAWAAAGRDTIGSQFFVFTGTAVHLQGEAVVFGRVVEGMDVVDRLHAGEQPDRIESVAIAGLEADRSYRPNDLTGQPAPVPQVPAPR